MDAIMFFLTQAKRKNGNIEKGCAVHTTRDNGLQAYHAYLSAYAYGHEQGTDYVFVALHDSYGNVVEPPKAWIKIIEPVEEEQQ